MAQIVTIGIPIYQSEKYIKQTLESALNQDYPNIEYILIDDGSNDKSLSIIKEIQENHPKNKNIKVIAHTNNMGVSATRNQIIKLTQGDYLFFMDSDDMISPHTIALLMQKINEYQADIVMGSYEKTSLSGDHSLYQYPDLFFESNNEFANFAYRKYAGIQASACNFLIKTSILREHQLRFRNSKFWEDTVFTLELVTFIERAVLLSNITYSYLCRKGSLSDIRPNDRIEKKEIVQYFKTVDELKQRKDILIKKPYYPNRCYIAIMSDIYIICNILKRWKYISPSFTFKELKSQLNHPARFLEILTFRQARLKNLLLYLLGIIPAPISIGAIWCMGKMKKII